MQRLNKESPQSTTIQELCAEFRSNNAIPRAQFERFDVKRGLRNADGTGVMAGLTHVCNVHGYLIDDGDKIPDKGRLTYRGISIEDIVQGCQAEGRFGFEEVAWLLIFGKLPDQRQYKRMCDLLYDNRELPEYFPEDMILKAPSRDIMNKLSRSVLALYSYDDDPEDSSLENNMRQGISLIARMPSIMAYSYQVKRRHFDKESMFFHPYEPGHRTAEAILNALRPDRYARVWLVDASGGQAAEAFLQDIRSRGLADGSCFEVYRAEACADDAVMAVIPFGVPYRERILDEIGDVQLHGGRIVSAVLVQAKSRWMRIYYACGYFDQKGL